MPIPGGQMDEHHGNSTKIRFNERIACYKANRQLSVCSHLDMIVTGDDFQWQMKLSKCNL